MPRVYFNRIDGGVYEVDSTTGESLMQIAQNNAIPEIIGDCGGSLSCGTCHVYIDEAWTDRLPPPAANEKDMVECAVNPRENSRLSCQVFMTDELDGIVVRLPERQM
jgi:ferredoxin, 2Fe-2S